MTAAKEIVMQAKRWKLFTVRLGAAQYRRGVDHRGAVGGNDDHAVVRGRARPQWSHRALHAHALTCTTPDFVDTPEDRDSPATKRFCFIGHATNTPRGPQPASNG